MNFVMMQGVGWAWSMLLVVGGAFLATRSGEFPPGSRSAIVVGGVTSVLAGQFVFLVMVADRLFPRVRWGLRFGVETALMLSVVGGIATTAAILAGYIQ